MADWNEMNGETADVRAQVERIANSTMFAESERLRRFLRFTVESRLRGDHERIKEYVLGREVFDRNDKYDPRIDPIVRVEARRLRSKLLEYYDGPGRTESIHIDYPKGSYLPVFVSARKTRRPVDWRRRTFLAVALAAAIALVLIAGAVAYRAASAKPSMIAILPAQWLWRGDIGHDPAGIGLSEALNAEIANRGFAHVVAWPIIVEQQAQLDSLNPTKDAARRFGASEIITVTVSQLGAGSIITVFVIDPNTGEKLRAEHYFVRNVASRWVQAGMAAQIAADLHASGRL